MKTCIKIILSVALALTTALFFVACGESQNTTVQTPVSNDGGNTVQEEKLPTPTEIVEARKNSTEANVQAYDFTIDFSGDLSVLGLSKGVTGKYDAKYRYDKTTKAMQFSRTTSGALLYDSTEYISGNGEKNIKIVMNDKGQVKKTSVINTEDELNLINKPVEALIDSLSASEITAVTKVQSGDYKYSASLNIKSDNAILNVLLKKIGGLGSKISIKNVKFENPVNGLKMLFNMDKEKKTLTDFYLSMTITVPVKVASININVEYARKAASAAVTIPSVSGIIVEKSDIEREVGIINAAIANVKDDDAYSLDVFAKNELDPSWNKLAIKDSYTARMYKNTADGKVAFNHSYLYKAHTEEDGKESFSYILGNIKDDTVHLVNRKGTDTENEVTGYTADGQFDYLTNEFIQKASGIDCMKKITENGSTFYYVYLNAVGARDVQNKILGIVNSNDGEGVTKVNNYFDAENNTIRSADIVIEIKDGKIVKVDCSTEIVYNPTAGEYTDYNVNLKNTLTLEVNKKLSDAQKYETPKNALSKLRIGDLEYLL